MKEKFKYLNYLDKIKRFRGISISRHKKIRLDANERISPFSEKFIKNLKKKINSNYLSAYPETEYLYSLLSKSFGLKKFNYFLTAGSDIGIRHCFELLVKKNSEIIILDPTFGMYDIYSKIYKAKVKKIYYDDNLEIDIDKFLKKITNKTVCVFFSNPNSPTGTILKEKDILKILEKTKKLNCYVIIDEAYYGFYKKTFANYVNFYSNLIILRTFSKSQGLAGIRAGYIIANKNLIKRLYKFRPMYEINAFAVLVIKEILKYKKEVKKYIEDTKRGKLYLEKKLKELNLKYHISFANFILVNFKNPSLQKKIYKILDSKKILVRLPPAIPACKNHLRFTLGPEKYMKILIKNIERIIKNEKYSII